MIYFAAEMAELIADMEMQLAYREHGIMKLCEEIKEIAESKRQLRARARRFARDPEEYTIPTARWISAMYTIIGDDRMDPSSVTSIQFLMMFGARKCDDNFGNILISKDTFARVLDAELDAIACANV